MAIWDRKPSIAANEQQPQPAAMDIEKTPYNLEQYPSPESPKVGELEEENPHHSLHRGLQARQVSMIAIGGEHTAEAFMSLGGFADLLDRCSGYWSDHWNWKCSGEDWSCFDPHLVHARWRSRLRGYGQSW